MDKQKSHINHNRPTLQRKHEALENGLVKVSIGNLHVIVNDNPFWCKFAAGWEPDTLQIYQRFVTPGATVLDIGAWIGPTILFALSCHAAKIVALEPNPQSYAVIKRMMELNPQLAGNVTLSNQAVSSQTGEIMMGLAKGETDTSTSGLMGNDFIVQTTTIDNLIRRYQLDQINLIKIDIEGAEALLVDDFHMLGQRPGQVIHLSVHVPLFPDYANKSMFAQSLSDFNIYDDRGQWLGHDQLQKRLLTDEKYPQWGTKHGNFFELLLIV